MIFFLVTLSFLGSIQASTTDELADTAKQGLEVAKEKTQKGLEYLGEVTQPLQEKAKEGMEYLDEKTQPLQEKSKELFEEFKKKWEESKDKDKTVDDQPRENDLI